MIQMKGLVFLSVIKIFLSKTNNLHTAQRIVT